MTSFPGFRLSILTFCHTPFQINASTFYFHNSTFTVLLTEFIICIHLDKTYCTTYHKVFIFTVYWQLLIMYALPCILAILLPFNLHFSPAYLGLLPKDGNWFHVLHTHKDKNYLQCSLIINRPVARIFWRGVTSMSNVYICVYKQTSRQD